MSDRPHILHITFYPRFDCAIRELTHIVTFEEATMSDSDPGSRDDPRLRPCKVRIYDTDEGPVLEHSTITQWDWDCMEFLLAEARYYAENWRGLRIAVIPELPFPWETRTQPGGDSD